MRSRPVGVTILAALFSVGGAAMLGLWVLSLSRAGSLGQVADAGGFSLIELSVSMLLRTGMLLVAGVGLWRGTRVGWGMTAFYLALGMAGSVSALVLAYRMSPQLVDTARGPEYYYIKYAARVVTHYLTLMYLALPGVLRYFGLERSGSWRVAGALTALAAVMCGLAAASQFAGL